MLFLLISTALALFVPFEATRQPFLQSVDNYSLGMVLNMVEYAIILAIPDTPTLTTYFDVERVSNVASLLSDRCFFGVTVESELNGELLQSYLETPYILFFQRGNFISAVSLPNEEENLLFVVKSWLDIPSDVCDTLECLYSKIGMTSTTILAQRSQITQAYTLMVNYLPYLEQSDVVLISKNLSEILEIGDDKLGLFRKDDFTIVPIDDNPEAIVAALKPSYQVFNDRKLMAAPGVVVAFILQKVDHSIRDFFYTISEKYSMLSFGIIEWVMIPSIQKVVNEEYDNLPMLVAFDPVAKFSYRMNSSMKGLNLSSATDLDRVRDVIEKIANNELPRSYISETATEQRSEYIVKLTGNSYASFVNNTDEESLVLYQHGHDQEVCDILEEVAKHCYGKHIRFGFINIEENSSPCPYPAMIRDNHIELFTTDGQSVPYLGSLESESILTFIAAYSKYIKALPSLVNLAAEISQIEDVLASTGGEFNTTAQRHLQLLYSLRREVKN